MKEEARKKGKTFSPREVDAPKVTKTASGEDKKKMEKMVSKFGLTVNDPKMMQEEIDRKAYKLMEEKENQKRAALYTSPALKSAMASNND